MGKTNSLNENDLADFIKLAKTQKLSDNSWFTDIKKINKDTYDLGVKNPNIVEKKDERTPAEIITEIEDLDKKSAEVLKTIIQSGINNFDVASIKEIEDGDHHDPNYLELYCDQNPSEPECLVYDDWIAEQCNASK